MLVQLLPDQVSERWDTIAPMIEETLPEMHRTQGAMTNVLRSVMLERATVWMLEEDGEGLALVLTAVDADPVTGGRFLLIYSLYGIEDLKRHHWEDGLETLMKYARSKNCGTIVAYTNRKGVAKYAHRLGARVEFIRIEIDT